MEDLLQRFTRDERGATAAEYAMLIGAAAVLIAATLYQTGETLSDFWASLGERLFE